MPFYVTIEKDQHEAHLEIPTMVLDVRNSDDGNFSQVSVVHYRFIDDAESIGFDLDDPTFLPLGSLSETIDFDSAYLAELIYHREDKTEKGLVVTFDVYACGANKFLVVGNDSANPQLFIEDDAFAAFNRLSDLQDKMV